MNTEGAIIRHTKKNAKRMLSLIIRKTKKQSKRKKRLIYNATEKSSKKNLKHIWKTNIKYYKVDDFMGRHVTTFEKRCLCFRCPLNDCKTPCPFGMDGEKYIEDVDEYFMKNEERIKWVIENEKRKEKNRKYYQERYLKKKQEGKKRKGIKNMEQFMKDMFGN